MKIIICVVLLILILEIPIIKRWVVKKKDLLDVNYKSNKKWKDDEGQ